MNIEKIVARFLWTDLWNTPTFCLPIGLKSYRYAIWYFWKNWVWKLSFCFVCLKLSIWIFIALLCVKISPKVYHIRKACLSEHNITRNKLGLNAKSRRKTHLNLSNWKIFEKFNFQDTIVPPSYKIGPKSFISEDIAL